MLHAVIMAGGGGTRFWPRSRQQRPKQFLALTGDGSRSLLQLAHDRLAALVPPERLWVITAASQRDLVAEQLPEVPPERIIGEPCGRDTAACIGLGAALIAREDSEAVMIATPADHVIEPVALFQRTLQAAAQLAEEHLSALLTLGIPPVHPATGYGYIQRGDSVPGRFGIEAYRVAKFKEKPDAVTAQQYLDSGQFFWNSGIFIWNVHALRAELRRHESSLFMALDRIAEAWTTPHRDTIFQVEYESLPRRSIDFAVMEKAQEVLVLRAPFVWDDLGSWQALERHHPQDAAGNTVLNVNHVSLDTKDCIVAGSPGQTVATVGVENLLIVQEGGTLLVANRQDETAVKRLVEYLQKEGRKEVL
jgi:mannose-1-phosphate guanylyltransferase